MARMQVEKLYGKKGDEMRELREVDKEQFQGVVQLPQFTEWNLTLKTNSA